MNIMETIKEKGIDNAILEMMKAIKEKDETITILNQKILDYEKQLAILGTAPTKTTRKKKENLCQDNSKAIQKSVGKIVKRMGESVLGCVCVRKEVAIATNLKETLTFMVSETVSDGLYDGMIYAKTGVWQLSHLSIDKFPYPLELESEFGPDMKWKEMKESWNKVRLAVGDDESRYFMNGVFFKNNVMVATDGHRASIVTFETPFMSESKAGIIVPYYGSTLEMLANSLVFRKDRGNGYFATFAGQDFTYMVRTIDGQYPDYTRVIPTNNTTATIELPTKETLKKWKVLVGDSKRIYFYKDKTVIGSTTEKSYFSGELKVTDEDTVVVFKVDQLLDIVAQGITHIDGLWDHKAWTGRIDNLLHIIMPCIS